MAKCEYCRQDVVKSNGCSIGRMSDNSWGMHPRVLHRSDDDQRCPDCNAMPGHFHHQGCTEEVCPWCELHMVGLHLPGCPFRD